MPRSFRPIRSTFPDGRVFHRGPLISPSDRNLKENFQEVDPRSVLSKVVQLPISTWNYKDDENAAPYMGPMAQEFRKRFGLGQDDTTIAAVDKDGVALAAIQGLHHELQARDQKISQLERRLRHIEAVLAARDEK